MPRKQNKKTASAALAEGSAERKDRHTEILRAAYWTIAEKGFEGLRMREIAARAGLNHATLHYYFHGKEALIAGVMDYMVEELSLGRDNQAHTGQQSPREQLAAHFAALLRQQKEQPEMFIVLGEIHTRAARDPAIRSVMAANERRWKKFISAILQAGIRCGEFDPALAVDVAAETVLAAIRGLNFESPASQARAARVLEQLTTWLGGGSQSTPSPAPSI